MHYRRSHLTGGCFFFTLVTYRRQKILTIDENITRLRAAMKKEMGTRPFSIDAIVILPDHMHTIWNLPAGDSDYSTRWRNIKRYFSIGCVGANSDTSVSRQKKREKNIWQRRFWEHAIRDENDWRRHIDYIHFNPVKHGYVPSANEWPYSSFGRCVDKGWYDRHWGSVEPETIRGMNFE